MKDTLIKYAHIILILYAAFQLFTMFEEHEVEITNLNQRLEATRAKVVKTKRQLKQIDEFRKKVGNFKERVKEINAQIEKVQKQLPTDVNDTVVQQNLTNIASNLKIKESAPAPGKEMLNGFYYAKEYQYSGKGTFLQFLVLMEQLEKSERILNVKSVEIGQGEEKARTRYQVLNAKITLESFRYNSKYEQKSGVTEIENQFNVK